MFRDAGRGVRDFVRGGFELIGDIKQSKEGPLDPGEVAIDLPFSEVLIAIVMIALGLCIIYPFWVACALLKFVPAIIKYVSHLSILKMYY